MNITIPENIPTFDLFVGIVPNLPHHNSEVKENGHGVVRPGTQWAIKNFMSDCEDVNRLGVDIDDINLSTMWVQVWVRDAEGHNLTDHGVSRKSEIYSAIKTDYPLIRWDNLLPGYLPETFLNGCVEGGTKITYTTKVVDGERVATGKIVWHWDNLNFRYGSFGKFDEVFSNLIKRARAFRRSVNKAA